MAVGYNHPSNFVHDFKHRYGMPPGEYRRCGHRQAALSSTACEKPLPVEIAVRQRTGARKVLIIDDDQGTRDTLGEYLRLEGYDVALASTAREGIDTAARFGPQSILLDYHLPDIDGLACLRLLRQNKQRAKVVLFTADWETNVDGMELRALNATLASKLCGLEDVERLVAA